MNTNLSSESIFLSLAVTSLIGLWLIWQAVKINPGIDIWKISVNWLSDRLIVFPSVLFLISPFLSAYIFQNLQQDYNKIFDNRIIAQLLTTVGTVISIYIGNRALESFRKNQEQKKIGKILITSMESHIEYLKKMDIKPEISRSERESIENRSRKTTQDYIYESALKSIGILEITYINIISEYSRQLNSVTDEILNTYNPIPRYIVNDESQILYILPPGSKPYLKEQIQNLIIFAHLNIMIISKEILQDNNKFYESKSNLKEIYISQRRDWEQYKERCKVLDGNRDYSDSNIFIDLKKPLGLKETEKIFKSYDMLAELENLQ